MHLLIFRAGNADVYRLKVFTTGRLVSQLLLVLCLALHILTNIRPLMISLGAKSYRAFALDAIIVLTVLLALFAVAFGIYWLRWAAY